MLPLLIALALSQSPQHRIFRQPNLPRFAGTFEFAPASGAGMGAECAGTVPTGSGGEVVSFTRATAATCCKADGSCVDLSNGQPAVSVCEGCSSGPLGVTSEKAVTARALRCIELDNAAWTAVAGGTVTANQYDGPFAAGELDRINCAAGGDGIQQVIATTAQNHKAFSLWLRSGTASAVTISITGTGNAAGDRSKNLTVTSTPTRYAVVTTAAYGAGLTAITVRILCNGVTGNFGAGHAQMEEDDGNFTSFFGPTSHIHTAGSAVTRNATTWSITTPSWLTDARGCTAVSTRRKQYDAETPAAFFLISWGGARYMSRPFTLTTNAITFDGTTQVQASSATSISAAQVRFAYEWEGATQTAWRESTSVSGAYDGALLAATTELSGSQNTAWLTGIFMSGSPSRCRP